VYNCLFRARCLAYGSTCHSIFRTLWFPNWPRPSEFLHLRESATLSVIRRQTLIKESSRSWIFGFWSVGNLETDCRRHFYLVVIVAMLRFTGDWRNETDVNNGETDCRRSEGELVLTLFSPATQAAPKLSFYSFWKSSNHVASIYYLIDAEQTCSTVSRSQNIHGRPRRFPALYVRLGLVGPSSASMHGPYLRRNLLSRNIREVWNWKD
jgi:hypothetical protein